MILSQTWDFFKGVNRRGQSKKGDEGKIHIFRWGGGGGGKLTERASEDRVRHRENTCQESYSCIPVAAEDLHSQ